MAMIWASRLLIRDRAKLNNAGKAGISIIPGNLAAACGLTR
jgi:hypothetical protein